MKLGIHAALNTQFKAGLCESTSAHQRFLHTVSSSAKKHGGWCQLTSRLLHAGTLCWKKGFSKMTNQKRKKRQSLKAVVKWQKTCGTERLPRKTNIQNQFLVMKTCFRMYKMKIKIWGRTNPELFSDPFFKMTVCSWIQNIAKQMHRENLRRVDSSRNL